MPTDISSLLTSVVPLLAIVVLFYFLLIRPQQKKDKAVKKMLNELSVGNQVTTIGGVYGTISKIKDDILTIDVGQDKVKLVVAKWAIRSVNNNTTENDALSN